MDRKWKLGKVVLGRSGRVVSLPCLQFWKEMSRTRPGLSIPQGRVREGAVLAKAEEARGDVGISSTLAMEEPVQNLTRPTSNLPKPLPSTLYISLL